jgi:hypothetical protein
VISLFKQISGEDFGSVVISINYFDQCVFRLWFGKQV